MKNQKGISSLIGIVIIVVVAVVAVGSIFVYQYYSTLKEGIKEVLTGTIEGSLGYPSDYIPSDMKICAENIITKKEYCTDVHIKDSKYKAREGYKIEVPAGNYYVFATIQLAQNGKAYYSEFVTCGLKADCPSHEPIVITIDIGQNIKNVDPVDWYKPPEKFVKDETSDWKTYTNDAYGFEFKYPREVIHILKNPEITTCFDGSGVNSSCEIYAKSIIEDSLRDDKPFVVVGDIYVTVVNHKLEQKDIHKYDKFPLIGESIDVTSKVLIGGVNGYKYDLVSSVNYKIQGFMVPLNDKYIEIGENSKDPRVSAKEWEKIISTFKFTK